MKPDIFFSILKKEGIDFFCGVPDSLLKDFCFYVDDNCADHIVCANEGNAIAMACGHYLATGKIACVYMQNSGLGNCINPLLSLSDPEVYNIPLLMIIGMRGAPNVKDEPQHIKQGKVTDKLLDAMQIKYSYLSQNIDEIKQACNYMKETKRSYAFLVNKGFFEKYERQIKPQINTLSCKEAVVAILEKIPQNSAIVSTTGHISRYLYQARQDSDAGHAKDFLTVGSMGHCSSIAAEIARQKPTRQIFCFDGDGAFLMHMGSISVIASLNLKNFKHIVFNNNAHASVGGLATVAGGMDFQKLAKSCGYKEAYIAANLEELKNILPDFIEKDGPALLEIKIKQSSGDDLPRPKEKPADNKELFMDFLQDNSFIGKESINKLQEIIADSKNILIFTGNTIFEKIKDITVPLLKGKNVDFYNDFSTNPNILELQKALNSINKNYDTIIAVGGGSVIDFAKLYKYETKSNAFFIAIPTTAGSGSQATKFAVCFVDGKKKSIESDNLLPNIAIVDPQFLKDSPRYLKACCAFDALSQSIESFWSIYSTPLSRKYALASLELCKDNIVSFVNSEDEKSAYNMALAAHLSGKAINISKTTVAHALSYVFNVKYNIAHGHAVALSFARAFEANVNIAPQDLLDKRGADFYKNISNTLKSMFNKDYFQNLFMQIGLETNLTKLGIKNISDLVKEVNLERLSNNPRKFTFKELENLFFI